MILEENNKASLIGNNTPNRISKDGSFPKEGELKG